MRIASLLASGTELVCALGAGDELVGRSHECDHPAWVTRLPVLSRPTFPVDGSSREVDTLVREKLRAGEPLYAVDEALLTALEPDVVITQTHCEVCAVSPGDATGGARCLQRKQVVALRAGSLEGILTGFLDVATVLHRRGEGEALVLGMRHRMSRWREATTALPRTTVVCLEWTDPPFAMGNWGPELVELAGGADLIGTAGVHSSAVEWEQVCRVDPEVLIVAPCGFGLERAAAEMPGVAARPGFSQLRAARAGRVFVADGNFYFNRSGPAVFDTIDLLAHMLHPDRFPPRGEGIAWRRWPG